MAAIQRISSLTLVKDELDATLKQAEANLEGFIDEPAGTLRIDECIECFHQAWGVLKVLEIPGAADLAQELETVARTLREHGIAGRDNEIAAMGSGIMVLGRYIEFLQVKAQHLPQLLVPVLNSLRQANGRPPVPESAFFPCDLAAHRPGEGGDALESDAEVARLARRLRQMYQVGLLGVLRDANVATNLRMMDRALERLDKIGGGTPMGRLWWSTRGALRTLSRPGAEIDRTQKLFLGGVDRQLKRVAQEGGTVLREEPNKVILREAVYLASLLPVDDEYGAAIRKTFRIPAESPTAEQLATERDVMMGPGGSVIRTVSTQVRADIAGVKDLLDQASRTNTGFVAAADEVAKVAHTLVMLGLVRESQSLKERAEQLRGWEGKQVDPQGAEFQGLIDTLLAVEDAVTALEKRFTPGETHAQGGGVSLYQLDDARRTVMAECRSGIALAKRGVTSYIEANFDRMHLNNIPATLKGVAGGLRFLNLDRAVGILDACSHYIDGRLLNANLPVPGHNDMETFADAITSVDYFLESMEEHKPIGEGVLEIAEMSMEELGCPVAKKR